MPCDRSGQAPRTRPEMAAVCRRTFPAYCGPIKSSQFIKFKTGPIKAKFNGGKRMWPNSQFLVKLSRPLFYGVCTKKREKKAWAFSFFFVLNKKASGEIKGDRKLALEWCTKIYNFPISEKGTFLTHRCSISGSVFLYIVLRTISCHLMSFSSAWWLRRVT